MEAVVTRCFCDRTDAGRFVPEGAVYSAAPERIAELAARGIVDAPPEPQPQRATRKAKGAKK